MNGVCSCGHCRLHLLVEEEPKEAAEIIDNPLASSRLCICGHEENQHILAPDASDEFSWCWCRGKRGCDCFLFYPAPNHSQADPFLERAKQDIQIFAKAVKEATQNICICGHPKEKHNQLNDRTDVHCFVPLPGQKDDDLKILCSCPGYYQPKEEPNKAAGLIDKLCWCGHEKELHNDYNTDPFEMPGCLMCPRVYEGSQSSSCSRYTPVQEEQVNPLLHIAFDALNERGRFKKEQHKKRTLWDWVKEGWREFWLLYR
jgi:hypothetical protein